MRVAPLSALDESGWDTLCERSDDAWLFHRSEWIRLEEALFVEENLSFGLVSHDRIVGVQPLYLRKVGLGSFEERLVDSGLHRHTGLALDPDLDADPKARADARAAALTEILRLGAAHEADRIGLNEQNLAPRRFSGPPELPYWASGRHGFELGVCYGPDGLAPAPGMSTMAADQIVALEATPEALHGRLSKSARQGHKRGSGAGLAFRVGGADAPARYGALAAESRRRTGEAAPDDEYLARIWSTFAGPGRCHFLFAELGAHTVAGVVILVDKGAAHLLASASDPASLDHAPNDFLQWETILWAREQGLRRYRLGPVFPSLPESWPIVRVSRFKGKFGGLSVPIIEGSCFRRPERYLELGLAGLKERCEARLDA